MIIMKLDQILAAKQKDPNADTSALEQQIDKIVYELYGLICLREWDTHRQPPEEISIVEGKK